MQKEFERLSKLPKVSLGKYRCEGWIEAVNHLKTLGKEKSLQILNAYFAKSPDHERIHLLCRLLFVNPDGWAPPKFGAPGPIGIDTQAIKEFPLFPFAISEDVPFVVVSGYSGGGKIGGGKQCLELCKKLELIKKDYATTGLAEAAKKLLESKVFLQLHPDRSRDAMIYVVRRQAERSEK